MSSQDEESDHGESNTYKKRRGRACDKCRSKKVRCDGKLGSKCANCVIGKFECTYVGAARKRYPDLARIEELENQLANMKKLLNKLHPGVDFTPALNGILDNKSLWLIDAAKARMSENPPITFPRPSLASSRTPLNDADTLESSDDELSSHSALHDRFKAVSISGGAPRFLGKSSRFMFFKKAFDYKYEYAGLDPPSLTNVDQPLQRLLFKKRTEFRMNEPWLLPTLQLHEVPHLIFPEDDLMTSCIDLYFTYLNVYLPLLHRPTFEREVRTGLHLVDEGFGSLLLLVCAVGARYSEDRRVLMDGTDSWHSAGWRWFCQVQSVRRLITLRSPKLYDMQICALVALYLHGSVQTQPVWTVTGYGLRVAQDIGAHRRKRYSKPPTVEEELMKRAFWVLISMDRSLSGSLGRPCGLQDEDFDVDLPTECDDEYWLLEDPKLAFSQPTDKPSYVAFQNCSIRLKQIHVFALRTIYAINRSKAIYGRVDDNWEQNIVSEIDSALNEWVDAIPEHLRWDPNRENTLHLNQSAFLWSAYYSTQINVHRPFIPSPRKQSSYALPSLAICTNAARSCIHVLDVQFKRTDKFIQAPNQSAVFTAAVVLLMNVWGSKRVEGNPDMLEVHKAMNMLKRLESRWFSAGRYWDILHDLASMRDLPLPLAPSPPTSAAPKRNRKGQPLQTTAEAEAAPIADATKESRQIAGQKRMLAHQNQSDMSSASASSSVSPPALFSNPSPSLPPPLPVYTADLVQASAPAFAGYPEVPTPSGISWIPLGRSPASSYDSSNPSPNPITEGSSNNILSFEQVMEELFSQAGVDSTPSPMTGFTFQGTHAMTQPQPGIDNVPASVRPAYSATNDPHAETSPNLEGISHLLGDDTLAIWSTAPSGFSWADWGAYASNFGGGRADPM